MDRNDLKKLIKEIVLQEAAKPNMNAWDARTADFQIQVDKRNELKILTPKIIDAVAKVAKTEGGVVKSSKADDYLLAFFKSRNFKKSILSLYIELDFSKSKTEKGYGAVSRGMYEKLRKKYISEVNKVGNFKRLNVTEAGDDSVSITVEI